MWKYWVHEGTPDMSQTKTLIIHLSRLGDMIQSLPAVKLLKEEHPESEITYFALEDFCIPLRGIPWIDTLVAIPSSDSRGILTEDGDIDTEAFDRLFQNNPELGIQYDVLINMAHNRGSSYLSQRIRAKEKRGRIFSKENEIVMEGNWAKYLFAVARNRNDNLLNLVDLYTGMAGVRNRPVRHYLPTNPAVDRECLGRLKGHGFDPGRLAVGFQLGASKSLRTWPPERFFRLGELLTEQLDAQIVLFGSAHERELADQFHTSAPFALIDLIGETTLTDLPSFLKCINVFVSNDTGPMHIAAAVGTKVVGIFMSTAHFRITGPYGPGHIAIQSNYPCSPCLDSTACSLPLCGRRILPEVVLEGVKSALGLEVGPTDGGDGADLYKSDFGKNGTLLYRKLAGRSDHFLSWLRSFHDNKAWVSQALWNEWLGLPAVIEQTPVGGEDSERAIIVQDYRYACATYRNLYKQGEEACQKIVAEFCSAKPRLDFLQDRIAQVEQLEQEFKYREGPLAVMRDIHELYSAEVEYCNFPMLAQEFIHKYRKLEEVIHCFEIRLEGINRDANRDEAAR